MVIKPLLEQYFVEDLQHLIHEDLRARHLKAQFVVNLTYELQVTFVFLLVGGFTSYFNSMQHLQFHLFFVILLRHISPN